MWERRTRRRMRRWVGEDGLSSSKRELGGFFSVSLYLLSYKGPDMPLTPEKNLGRLFLPACSLRLLGIAKETTNGKEES